MNSYTTSSHTVERDENGYSTSVTWTYKKYSNFTQEVMNRIIDAEGTTEDVIVNVVNEDDLVTTQDVTFVIPEHMRTTAVHEEPHVHEREMEYVNHYITWYNSFEQSDQGREFFENLNNA